MTEHGSGSARVGRTWIGRWTAGLVVLAIFGFFGRRMLATASGETLSNLSPDWTSAVQSLLLLLLGFGSMPLTWWAVLRGMGAKNRLRECFEVYALTNMGKYVPGSVWPVLGRTAMLSGGRGVAFASSTVEMTFKVVGALVVSLLFLSERLEDTLSPVVFGLVLAAALLVVHPRVFIPVAGLVGRALGREEEKISHVRYPWFAGAMLLSIFTWLLFGIAFGCLVNAFAPSELPSLVGIFSLAWVSGFLALPVPAGLGVREGVLSLSLAPILGEPLAIGVAFASRLWWMLGDLGFFFFGVVARGSRGGAVPR